jgi:AraC-like DNA-binding protein
MDKGMSPESDAAVLGRTTAGAWLHVLIRTLVAQGHDGAAMAIAAGIPPRHVRNPVERVPQASMTAFWKLAVRETKNPCIGLDAARFVTGSTFGALTHVAFVSPTLEDAFRRIVRFQRLMTDSMTLDLVCIEERYRLIIRQIARDHPPAEELDAFWATWVRVTRKLAPNQPYVEPLRIHRRRRRPPDLSVFERVFRAPMRFGAQADFIEYDRNDCRKRLSDANIELAKEYDQILTRHAARLAGATLTERVRALLFEILSDGPTESEVARRLCMGKSSIKAALARESTTYRIILEEVRQSLACQYLGERGYSIKEVAFLLGYADASTFSRAFRSWSGESPAAYASRTTEGS